MRELKTIFFTLSSPLVFRNLFFFPGSVFDQLREKVAQDQNLRIVFLVQKRDYEKYLPFFADHLSDRIILEKAPPARIENIFQKFFYFFYSYLIYTGTTRTLATLGVRPDEPPAGGKMYLAPIKILIARTFGRLKFIKAKIVPWIYLRLFGGENFSSLFSQYNPSMIFAGHIYGQFDTRLLGEAKRRQVKTAGMISNWDHFDKYYLPLKPDFLLAQSEQIKDMAVKFQSYNSADISMVGYPHIDFIVSEKYAATRGEILKDLGFSENSKYILYISGSAYCPDEPDTIENILKWADDNKFGLDTKLVIRPYLGGRGADRDFDEKKYNRFEEHPRVVFYKKEFWGDLARSTQFINIMRHADAVISIYSTAVLEAAALNRPLVGIGFDGYKVRPFNRSIRRFMLREHFHDVLNSGGVSTAENFDDLFKILDNYLKNPHLHERERDKMFERLCYKRDGLASERVVTKMLDKLI